MSSVTALGKLVRSTAFKLSAIYLLSFTLFAVFILGYVAWNARALLTAQISETIEAEVTGLAEQFRQGGIRRLVFIIERRSRQPGAFLYLLSSPDDQGLAGNAVGLTPELLTTPGWHEAFYTINEDHDASQRSALVRVFLLPGGFHLLVGRDVMEREQLRGVIRRGLTLSLGLVVLLGTLGGLFITRRVLKRVDGMSETAQSIMAGNLAGRLAVSGNGDELDRLAANLNAMLDRIGELMTGLREVSDNIAHDLKTPLTRLRNGAEEALRTGRSDNDYRRALDRMIDESDGLIRTFNALLMIARAESGTASEAKQRFDAATVVRDVAELYEPVAEEAGLSLRAEAPDELFVVGSRELLSQALANLADNAIKYGATADGPKEIVMSAALRDGRAEIAVADRGPGVPTEDRQRVLDRFTRLDTSSGKPGSGLGLSLAAAIAHFHGGVITLEDNEPGLRVVLSLPGAPLEA
jgi:signal transduction histidine kinase